MRVGIDVGGTKIEAAALATDGRVLLRRRVATPAGDYAGTIAAIRGNGTVLAAYWQYVNALWILLLVFLNTWS